jgi:hypothetical protein
MSLHYKRSQLHIQAHRRYKAIQFSYTSGISLYTAIGTILAATAVRPATATATATAATLGNGNGGSTGNGNGNGNGGDTGNGGSTGNGNGNGNGGSTGNGNGNGNGGDTGNDLIQTGVDDDGIAFSRTGFPLGLSCPLPKIFQFFKLSMPLPHTMLQYPP